MKAGLDLFIGTKSEGAQPPIRTFTVVPFAGDVAVTAISRMRSLIRTSINGTLRFGLELRRKHDIEAKLEAVQFGTVIDGGANVGDYAACRMREASWLSRSLSACS